MDLRWLSTTEPPVLLPEAGAGGEGIGNVVFISRWEYATTTTVGDPGTGHYRLNNPDTPTIMMLSQQSAHNIDRATELTALQIGDQIVLRPISNTSSWRSFVITTTPVDNGAWWQFSVVKVNEAGTVDELAANQEVLFDFYHPTPTPGTMVEVNDILTDELLIPRIDPEKHEESKDDFDKLTDDERKHDGLWVWAVGGLPGT